MLEIADKGAQAEQAQSYISDVVNRAKDMILDRIMSLQPHDTAKFTIYKSQLILFEDLEAMVAADINAGRQAIANMQDGALPQKGGIL